MKEIILEVYSIRCKYLRKCLDKAMDNMEKYIYSGDSKQFKKYRNRSYKYRMKWLKAIEKHSKLIGA